MNPKPWWQSRTLWLNTALAIGVVVEANLGLLRDALGPRSYLAAMALAAGANFALRFLTSQSIGQDVAGK